MAILRTEAGREPHDKDLHDLVGEPSTRSVAFRTRWGAHDVRLRGTGPKRFHHPLVGALTLTGPPPGAETARVAASRCYCPMIEAQGGRCPRPVPRGGRHE